MPAPLDDEYVRGELAMKDRVRRGQLPPCLCRQPYRRKRIGMAGSMGRWERWCICYLRPRKSGRRDSPIRAPKRPMCWSSNSACGRVVTLPARRGRQRRRRCSSAARRQRGQRPRLMASATMMVVTFVGAETMSGMIDASITCRRSAPRTAPLASTTAPGSSALPMGTDEVG